MKAATRDYNLDFFQGIGIDIHRVYPYGLLLGRVIYTRNYEDDMPLGRRPSIYFPFGMGAFL